MNDSFKRRLSAFFAGTMIFTVVAGSYQITYSASESQNAGYRKVYKIINPYKSVDWANYGQYKAGLHSHTTESDGAYSVKDMIENAYGKDYDVLAITDHDVANTKWDRTDKNPNNYLTTERLNEINSGTDRKGKALIGIPFTSEQSVSDHVNTFWANFSNGNNATLESNIAKCEELGGISHINHPGDAASSTYFIDGQITESGAQIVSDYVNLYKKYPSCVGIEIFNKRYGNRESFRHFWDNVLMNTMPNRPVWGFAGDDAHSAGELGYNFNMLLMPSNTEKNIRYSMENGTFYAVALSVGFGLEVTPEARNSFPVINNIIVNEEENSITIKGDKYDVIEWVVDNKIIATGPSIDLNNYEHKVKNYVRAQLKGPGGFSFTQPFGIIEKSSIMVGDINNDKKISATDCLLLKQHILGLEGCILTGEGLLAADVDKNSRVNAIDLLCLKKIILGISD